MKVLQLITGLAMGGAEKVVVDLCTKSKEFNDHEFFVVSLSDNLDRKPVLETMNIPVLSLGITRNGKNLMSGIQKLRKFISINKIDLIHAHMTHAYILALFGAMGKSIPIIFTGHNTNFGYKIREYFIWATKPWRHYDIVFEADQQKYFHKGGNKTQVISNGIPIAQTLKQQEGIQKNNQFTFINIGNLEKQKNQIALIDIALKLKRKGKKFQIQIVGEGSKMNELQQAIAEKDLKSEVILMGKRMDVPALMAAAHCFLMPSLWEGMPITILEAGVSRLPIISTPVGNISHLLKGERGYIAPINEFPDQMQKVMDHYPAAILRSEKLYSHIKAHFSLDSSYQKHIELYTKALG